MSMIPDTGGEINSIAERSLLGETLSNHSIVGDMLATVRREHYHTFAHGLIHATIADLHSRGVTVDIVTVGQAIAEKGLMTEIGGVYYLADLMDSRSVAREWQHWAGIIKDTAQRRDIIRMANEMAERAGDMGESPGDIMQAIEARCRDTAGVGAKSWWNPKTTAQLIATAKKPEWMVQRLLVARQPCIVGAAKKGMKTSSMLDLGVSLATATPFLGRFPVYKKHRVAFVSGESGDFTTLETVQRISAARGSEPPDITWNFEMPRLNDPRDLSELTRAVKGGGYGAMFLDPLYLMLLATGDASNASNLFAMGPLLSAVSRACLDADCTPILIHHAKKSIAAPNQPMELEDLSFAGVQEFARQWLLLSRRAPFRPGSGKHELWLSAGGSCGQGGLWAVNIDEGQLDDDFGGRKWDVEVVAATDAIEREQDVKEDRKTEAASRRERSYDTKLLTTLDTADPQRQGVGYSHLRGLSGLGGDQMTRTTARLIASGILEDVLDFVVTTANGGIRAARGIRRRDLSEKPKSKTEPEFEFVPTEDEY